MKNFSKIIDNSVTINEYLGENGLKYYYRLKHYFINMDKDNVY